MPPRLGGVGGPGQPRPVPQQPQQPQRPQGGGGGGPANPNNTGLVLPGVIDSGTWANSAGGPLDPRGAGGGGGAPPPTGPPIQAPAAPMRQPSAGLGSPGARLPPGGDFNMAPNRGMGGPTGVSMRPMGSGVVPPPLGGNVADINTQPLQTGGPVGPGAGMLPPMTLPQQGQGMPPPPVPARAPIAQPPIQPPPRQPAPQPPAEPNAAQTGRRRALQRMV